MNTFLKKYNYLVFDCDGVIFDSNKVKTEGFKYTLSKYPNNKVNDLINYHKANGGISRYEKFEYFFKEILNLTEIDESYKNALLQFKEYIDVQLFKVNFVEGVQDFIDYCIFKGKKLYIVSGADQSELNKLCIEKKIQQKFSLI